MKYLGRIKMKRPLMVLMVVVTVCLTAVGGIYAWSKLSASVTNNIKTPTVDTEVVEKFDKDSTVDWFDQVEKEVQFKNTGTAPVFLRVSYAEFWKDADGRLFLGQLMAMKLLIRTGLKHGKMTGLMVVMAGIIIKKFFQLMK